LRFDWLEQIYFIFFIVYWRNYGSRSRRSESGIPLPTKMKLRIAFKSISHGYDMSISSLKKKKIMNVSSIYGRSMMFRIKK